MERFHEGYNYCGSWSRRNDGSYKGCRKWRTGYPAGKDAAAWQEDADYSDILNKIASIKPKVAKKAEDEFAIGIPGAGVYTTLEDFKSQEAKSIMTQYLSDKRAIVQAQEKLDQLRQRYGNGEKNLANEINAWEKRIANMKLNLKDTKNQVVKCAQEFNR